MHLTFYQTKPLEKRLPNESLHTMCMYVNISMYIIWHCAWLKTVIKIFSFKISFCKGFSSLNTLFHVCTRYFIFIGSDVSQIIKKLNIYIFPKSFLESKLNAKDVVLSDIGMSQQPISPVTPHYRLPSQFTSALPRLWLEVSVTPGSQK